MHQAATFSAAQAEPPRPAVPFGDLLDYSNDIAISVDRIERAVHTISGAFPDSGKGEDGPKVVRPHMDALYEAIGGTRSRLLDLANHLEALANAGRGEPATIGPR